MTIFQGSLQETQDSFLFRVKISVDKFGSQHASENDIDDFDTFYLSSALVESYTKDSNAKIERSGKIVSISPQDESKRLLVFGHESGPEIFLIPMAVFLANTVTSGVVGNLAYDLLKGIYKKTLEAIKSIVQESNKRKLKRKEKILVEQDVINRLEIRLYTPDGSIVAEFDPEKGIPPEFVELIVKRLKQNQTKRASSK